MSCTTILGISWSRDPVIFTKLKSLLTRNSGGYWSAAARVASQHCRWHCGSGKNVSLYHVASSGARQL